MIPPPPKSTLFPYTTLFRSVIATQIAFQSRSINTKATRRWARRKPSRSNWSSITFLERSEEHTSELQSLTNLVCRLLLEKKNKQTNRTVDIYLLRKLLKKSD